MSEHPGYKVTPGIGLCVPRTKVLSWRGTQAWWRPHGHIGVARCIMCTIEWCHQSRALKVVAWKVGPGHHAVIAADVQLAWQRGFCANTPPSTVLLQIDTKNEYDKVIVETEAAYLKILESSQTLLTVLKRESVNIQKKRQAAQ